ncbi:MAG: hypothetical protein JJE17_13105 [Peptostreptococcaceae bacterium]|nr:hypothetical protein [Peptostreptococcaceae bacterium]
MAKSQAIRRSDAGKAKQKEIIELFKSIGHTQLSDGREISSLHLNELQEIYKYGIKK